MSKNKFKKVHVLCSYCRGRLHENFIEGDKGNLYCCTDCEEKSIVEGNHNVDGSKTSYYDIDVSDVDTIDINWLADKLNLTFYQGNVLKSLYGIANTKDRHTGTSSLRDAKKMLFYSQLILDKENKKNG